MKTTEIPGARLLGDIGGTNARFGWQAEANAPITHVRTLPCADFATLEDAMRAYLTEAALPPPAVGALGIANPVTSDRVQMTNHHWSFSIRELQASLGLQRLVVINDFTAMALSLPSIAREHLVQVGGGGAQADTAIALIGPGTGLGVSGLVPGGSPGRWLPIAGEGGHVTLAAQSDLEFAVIGRIRQRYGHVSAERVLSGPGLVDLYLALRDIEGAGGSDVGGAADISAMALSAGDPLARRALDLFAGFLGSTAGDLALTLGARGGVYIGGGIVPRWLGWFEQSAFRARFEGKGRFRSYLEPVPVYVINAPWSPALLGAAQALA